MEIKTHHHKYLEQTILTVFLWAGLWGMLSLFIDNYVQSLGFKLLVYFTLVLFAFTALLCRDHIKK